ncbi:DNA translocase FtsK [Sulfurovum riftiae]|uniref:FtsK gamma domain-containing protein n=1 Tax=Sulfurovum riftiae TaxID=1630136 RepID=A0A151CGE5_9BACT|nr:DNA translocase FtsK [Sulfurovum riftiae]KYJ86567.1 hypothetical protein AS592_07130 [Sulfurovum riftiae]
MIEDEVLMAETLKIVMQYKSFSPSLVQRKLEIGYTRAVRIVELLKEPYLLRLKIKTKPKMKLFSKRKKGFRYI